LFSDLLPQTLTNSVRYWRTLCAFPSRPMRFPTSCPLCRTPCWRRYTMAFSIAWN